jgi:hypothetical protein
VVIRELCRSKRKKPGGKSKGNNGRETIWKGTEEINIGEKQKPSIVVLF